MTALALIGLALGAVVLVLVIGLVNRVLGPALEIRRYAERILEAGVEIATNVDGVDELERTREHGAAVPGLATAYLGRLQGGEPS